MFITLQPKKFSMTLTKDLCEKNVLKLMDFEKYIYIYIYIFSKDTNEKTHCKEVQGVNF
jgi:hypothetical protein